MKRKATLVAILLGSSLALVPAAGAKVVLEEGSSPTSIPVATYQPDGMTNAEYQALLVRSAGLNALYGANTTSSAKPAAMTPAEFRALVLRGQALNALYGIGGTSVSPSIKPPAMTAAEYRALVIWGEALNARYGNRLTALSPKQFKQAFDQAVTQVNGSGQTTSGSGTTFDWNEAGFAVAAAMLLTLAFVAVNRRRHHRLGV